MLCDLTRPSCSRCNTSQQPCQYSQTRLKWINGVAARGKLAGQRLPIRGQEVQPIPRSVTSLMTQDGLLLYFTHAVVPRFNLGIGSLNIDLTFVNRDPVLQHAVLALANAHHTIDARAISNDTLFAKGQSRLTALEVFRKQLDGQHASPDDLFLANVFHCVLDGIIEPTDETAAMVCHFQGGKALLSHGDCLGRLNSESHGLSAFAMSIFATMDLVHALLSGQAPFFDEAWVMSRVGRDCWWGCLTAGDPFLGILSILARLARLGHDALKSQTVVPIDSLLSIQHTLDGKSLIPLNQADGNAGGAWAAFCTAYRSTAKIYMYRALCNLDSDHDLVQQATKEGVQAICKENLAGNLAHCMLFPMLVVGSH